jgi:hypothetical protein
MHPIPIARNGEEGSAAVQWKRPSRLFSPQQRTFVRADGAAQRQAQRLIGVPTETCVEFRYGDLLPQTLSVLKTISGNTDDEVRRGSATLRSGHIGGSADGPANPYPKGQMRSEFVLIASVGCKNLAQMGFAEDDDVIQAFSTDRANQPLRMPILPG